MAETPLKDDVVEELAMMNHPAPALVVDLAASPIPGVRIVAVARDEAHVYLTLPSYAARDVASLVELLAVGGADEVSWEEDHVRMWWD